MQHLRKDFPILKRTINDKPVIYFDSAASAHKPQQVIDALVEFYTKYNANVHRSAHVSAEAATNFYEQAREKVATFIGAHPHELVFTKNSTDAINTVALAWAAHNVQAGDEIVISQLEHHSNLVPWQQLAKKIGAILKYIPVLPNGMLDMDAAQKLITNKTKLVAVSYVSNVLGTTNDVAALTKMAHAVGARILIDAAQAVPYIKIDVHAFACDFLAFSAHKMLGPTGIGALYINEKIHKELKPYSFGGGMVFSVDFDKATWEEMPHILEAGTPPIAQAVGFGAAIDYLNNVDFAQLEKHEADLCARFIDGLQNVKGARVIGPVAQLKEKGHLVSFVIDDIHPHDIAEYLSMHGIFVRAGHHCAQPLAQKLGIDVSVRASFYLYNTKEEVDRCIEVLQQLVKEFSS